MIETISSPPQIPALHPLAEVVQSTVPGRLTLAVPTLREAGNLREFLARASAALSAASIDAEIIVVDDNSCDGTEEIVGEVARQDPRVRLLVRKGERGLSGAVLHGWNHGSGDILGVMDADLQHPPEFLPKLWQAMALDCDLALASRYAADGSLGSWSGSRPMFSRLAILAARPIQRRGIRVTDPMTGFFMVRRRCLDGIALQKEGFKLLLEILVRADIRSVREVPFTFGERRAGSSKVGMKVGLQYARLLYRLWRSRRPG